VQPGALKRVMSFGLPQRFLTHSRGHLYIHMEIEMPKCNSLTDNVLTQFGKVLTNAKNEEEPESKEEQTKKSKKKKIQKCSK